MSIMRGIAGRRNGNPIGIFIHNDAGGNFQNTRHYRNWLPRHNATDGFAHYYVCSDGIVQAEDDSNMAWHCGNADGNARYLSIEVCQSKGELQTFLSNEEVALKLAADLCEKYGINPSEKNIRLHQEVYATACPHRSVEVHGGVENTKAYFVRRIKHYMKKHGWMKDSVGWWYRHEDGSYTKDGWEKINGEWYYFNEKGYALENQWKKWKEGWYFLDKSCKMVTGWQYINGFWYCMDSSGKCYKGWVGYKDKWYYLFPEKTKEFPECAMATGLVGIDGKAYHFDKNGALETEIDLDGLEVIRLDKEKWKIKRG